MRATEPVEVDNETVLAALAEPRRILLMRLLSDKQLCTRDLVAATGMAQPLVSHQLRILRQALLVDSTVCANLRVYRLRADTLRVLGKRLAEMASQAAATSRPEPAERTAVFSTSASTRCPTIVSSVSSSSGISTVSGTRVARLADTPHSRGLIYICIYARMVAT